MLYASAPRIQSRRFARAGAEERSPAWPPRRPGSAHRGIGRLDRRECVADRADPVELAGAELAQRLTAVVADPGGRCLQAAALEVVDVLLELVAVAAREVAAVHVGELVEVDREKHARCLKHVLCRPRW